ncbi:hypothetical protein P7C73_g5401, partial [Tremellales sp. Uapishka_1]
PPPSPPQSSCFQCQTGLSCWLPLYSFLSVALDRHELDGLSALGPLVDAVAATADAPSPSRLLSCGWYAPLCTRLARVTTPRCLLEEHCRLLLKETTRGPFSVLDRAVYRDIPTYDPRFPDGSSLPFVTQTTSADPISPAHPELQADERKLGKKKSEQPAELPDKLKIWSLSKTDSKGKGAAPSKEYVVQKSGSVKQVGKKGAEEKKDMGSSPLKPDDDSTLVDQVTGGRTVARVEDATLAARVKVLEDEARQTTVLQGLLQVFLGRLELDDLLLEILLLVLLLVQLIYQLDEEKNKKQDLQKKIVQFELTQKDLRQALQDEEEFIAIALETNKQQAKTLIAVNRMKSWSEGQRVGRQIKSLGEKLPGTLGDDVIAKLNEILE